VLWTGRTGDRVERVSDNAMHQHRHEADEYRRIELITGRERRRRWTTAEKAAIVTESLQPGTNVSALARRHGVNRGLLQTWRRTAVREAAHRSELFVPLRLDAAAGFVDASMQSGEAGSAAPTVSAANAEVGTLVIESGDLRVRFFGPVDAAALRLVLTHVRRRA
jgi:transposase